MPATITATEIVRCLKRDGYTLKFGAKYCRDVAHEIKYGAHTDKATEQPYLEAAELLEKEAKAERLSEERVADLEFDCVYLRKRVKELETTILAIRTAHGQS